MTTILRVRHFFIRLWAFWFCCEECGKYDGSNEDCPACKKLRAEEQGYSF